jgi:hypothetical protein
MFDWLFEGHLIVYGVLGAAAVACVVLWQRNRKRRWLAGALAALALSGLYWLLDVCVETDSERLVRLVREMADGLKPHANLDPVFQHLSDGFRSPSGKTKQETRELAQSYLNGPVTDVRVWNIRCVEVSRERKTAVVEFEGKVHGDLGPGGLAPLKCVATFEFDGTEWKLKGMEVHLQAVPDDAIPGY